MCKCGNDFQVKPSAIKRGRGKFCSISCGSKGRTGKNNNNWKNNIGYSGIHSWIKKKYGKANKCVSKKCTGKSKIFQWALIKGKEYLRRRNHFKMLCALCHVRYDIESHYGQISGMRGKNHTEKTKRKMSEAHKGKIFTEETRQKLSETHRGKKHTEEAKKKMRIAHTKCKCIHHNSF